MSKWTCILMVSSDGDSESSKRHTHVWREAREQNTNFNGVLTKLHDTHCILCNGIQGLLYRVYATYLDELLHIAFGECSLHIEVIVRIQHSSLYLYNSTTGGTLK